MYYSYNSLLLLSILYHLGTGERSQKARPIQGAYP